MSTSLSKADDLRQHAVVQTLLRQYQQQQAWGNLSISHRLYLGCSGGRDSLALAYAAHLLDIPVHLIHVNHQIHPDAGDWANQVSAQAKCWQQPCHIQPVVLSKVNEDQARQARYTAFAYHMAAPSVLLLGHHQDDQAETVLLRLLNGAGVAGLAGMQTWTTRTVDIDWRFLPQRVSVDNEKQHQINGTITVWRPWLESIDREQITEFVQLAKLDYIDDPSNEQGGNDRSYLRQHVMPPLRQHWHAVTEAITRASHNLQQAKQALSEQVQADLAQCRYTAQQLSIERLIKLSQPRQYHVIRQWLVARCAGIQGQPPNRERVAQIYELANTTDYTVDTRIVWQGWQVRRYRQFLYLLCESEQTNAKQMPQSRSLVPHYQLKLSTALGQFVCVPSADIPINTRFALSTQLLGQTLCLRPRQIGERLQLANRQHHTSFKQVCQDMGIPPWQRPDLMLLTYLPTKLAIDNQTAQPIPIVLGMLTAQGLVLCQHDYLHDTKHHKHQDGWTIVSTEAI